MVKQKTIDKWNLIMKYRIEQMFDEDIADNMNMKKQSLHNFINRNKGKLDDFVEAHRVVRDVESELSTPEEFQSIPLGGNTFINNPLGTINGLDVFESTSITGLSSTGDPSPTFYGEPTIPVPSNPIIIDGPISSESPLEFIPTTIKIPTYNGLYQFIKNNPEHVHHDYFMRKIKRGEEMVEQIYVNQALITKILNLIVDMNY